MDHALKAYDLFEEERKSAQVIFDQVKVQYENAKHRVEEWNKRSTEKQREVYTMNTKVNQMQAVVANDKHSWLHRLHVEGVWAIGIIPLLNNTDREILRRTC